jgi:hypothetical protein
MAETKAKAKAKAKFRERLRPDWPILVYKYRAYPVGGLDGIPEALWENIRTQNDLWNRLVDIGERYLAEWEELKEEAKEAKREADKKAARAHWDAFRKECRDEGLASSLNWELRPWVVDRFLTAYRRGFQPDGGFPRKHGGIRRVCIVHRYTAGGLDVQKLPLVSKRAKRFGFLTVPSPEAYRDNSRMRRRKRVARGFFGVDGETIEFTAVLHRPLPQEGFVKQVAWLGEYRWHEDAAKRWTWHIAISVEVPPQSLPNPGDSALVAGLDIGWRRLEDYIRVGLIRDSLGRTFEICLPLDASNYRTRRDNLPSSWPDAWDLMRKMDKTVEDTKQELKQLLGKKDVQLPANLKRSVAHLQRAKAGGLRRLLRGLQDVENPDAAVTAAVDLLIRWRAEYNAIRQAYNAITGRLKRRREWTYGNVARWLAETYDVIVWRGDLNIKGLAEDKEKKERGALQGSMKYRQISAPSSLRGAIRHAASKYGAEIVEVSGIKTTTRCSVCDGDILPGPELVLTCENGHAMDQDLNGAINLLRSQIDCDDPGPADLRTNLVIPPQLSGVVAAIQ